MPKPYSSKQGKPEKLSHIGGHMTTICMQYLGLHLRKKKDISGKIGNIRKEVCNLVNGIAPTLIS